MRALSRAFPPRSRDIVGSIQAFSTTTRIAPESTRDRTQAQRSGPVTAQSVVNVGPDPVPEGWPPGLRSRFEILSAPTLIKRSIDTVVDRQVIDPLLSSAKTDSDLRRLVLLDGERGVGKSAVLFRAVESARSRGVVTLYIPSARSWTHGDGFFAATTSEGQDPIVDGPNCIRFYDRPTQTLSALEGIVQSHGDQLGDVPSTKHTSLLVDQEGLYTLRDVALFGITALKTVDADWRLNPRQGGDAFSRLILELSAQSVVPFLLAIDDYDAFLGLTSMVSGNARCLHADSIRAVGEHFGRRAIGRTAQNMLRGMVLVAVSRSHGRMKWRSSRVRGTIDYPITDDVRKDPSGSIWLDRLRLHSSEVQKDMKELSAPSGTTEFVPADWTFDPVSVAASESAECVRFVDVPELTSVEATSIVGEFESQSLIRELNTREKAHILALSGGRGDILHNLCKSA